MNSNLQYKIHQSVVMALKNKQVLASFLLLLLSPHFSHTQECNVTGECIGVLLSVVDAANAGECVYTCQHVMGCTW